MQVRLAQAGDLAGAADTSFTDISSLNTRVFTMKTFPKALLLGEGTSVKASSRPNVF